MSLTLATLVFGISLLIGGFFLFISKPHCYAGILNFSKSRLTGLIVLTLATAWFLFHVTQLGDADFGEYRRWLFIFFALIAIGSAIYLPEYLTIRSLAALILLLATPFLDAAFNQPYAGRLFMVSGVYLLILISLYLAISPYRWRDFFEWLYRNNSRPKILGGILLLYGGVSLAAIATYG